MSDIPDTLTLSSLPNLQNLFEKLNRGSHINRHVDHTDWVDLESNQATYTALFNALGYQLVTDPRGFAWFQPTEPPPKVSQNSRKLALFFLVLLEHQADQGLHLGKFQSWVVDRVLIEALLEKNRALLETESMGTLDGITSVLRAGARYGILAEKGQGWAALPAAYRYIDHFEALADSAREQGVTDSMLIAQEEAL